MQTIRYIFSDGTTSEIEVSDELYTLHLEIVQQKRRLHWRESRRQISLDNLTEQGIDFADTAVGTKYRVHPAIARGLNAGRSYK